MSSKKTLLNSLQYIFKTDKETEEGVFILVPEKVTPKEWEYSPAFPKKYPKNNIVIFPVSQGAIRALNSHLICSKIVWEWRVKLNEIGKNNKVSLIWITEHSGIGGNKKSNELTIEGALTSFIGPEPFSRFGKDTLKNILKKIRIIQTIVMAETSWVEKLPGNFNRERSKTYKGKTSYISALNSLQNIVAPGSTVRKSTWK